MTTAASPPALECDQRGGEENDSLDTITSGFQWMKLASPWGSTARGGTIDDDDDDDEVISSPLMDRSDHSRGSWGPGGGPRRSAAAGGRVRRHRRRHSWGELAGRDEEDDAMVMHHDNTHYRRSYPPSGDHRSDGRRRPRRTSGTGSVSSNSSGETVPGIINAAAGSSSCTTSSSRSYGDYELKNARDALEGSIAAVINFLGSSGVPKPRYVTAEDGWDDVKTHQRFPFRFNGYPSNSRFASSFMIRFGQSLFVIVDISYAIPYPFLSIIVDFSTDQLGRNLEMCRYFAVMKRVQDYVRCIHSDSEDETLAKVHLTVTAWEALCRLKTLEYKRAYKHAYRLRYESATPHHPHGGKSNNANHEVTASTASPSEIKQAIELQIKLAEQSTACQKKLYLVHKWQRWVLLKLKKASSIEPQGYQAIRCL